MGSLPFTAFPFKVQIHPQMLKRGFTPLGSVDGDLFTPPIGVKHQSDDTAHTSPGNAVHDPTFQQAPSQLAIQSELNLTLQAI